MTDSWTRDDEEYREAKAELLEPPPSRTLADEDPVEDKPRLKEPMGVPSRAGELRVTGPPLQFHPQPSSEHLQRQMTEREKLRAEELEHLTQLRDRVQEGIDEGFVSLESGTTMLLNISKARMALGGVGAYPGAW